MSNNQKNTEKILSLLDKFETEEYPELNKIIKNHMTQKLLTKSQEYSEIAERLRTQSEKILGEK